MDFATKLELLAADMRLIESGHAPTVEELSQAPMLLNWSVVPQPGWVLNGLVLDHPRLGTAPITTSQLFWISEDRACARTLSRYYRLSDAA